MSEVLTAPAVESDPATPETWLEIALLRRELEESGESAGTGARFNSFI